MGKNLVSEQESMAQSPPAQEVYRTVEEHSLSEKTPAAVFFGVCAANNWAVGKQVTQTAYQAAVTAFMAAPIQKGDTKHVT